MDFMKIGLHTITLKFAAILLMCCLCCGETSFAQGKKFNAQESAEWSGTGWALNQGYVVTNHHVVENARSIVLKFQQGEQLLQYDAQVVLTDAEHDLALLRMNNANSLDFSKLPPPMRSKNHWLM